MAAQGEEVKSWVTIYPAYLDATKTVAQGRKVQKELAVPKPTLAEIASCVRKLGFLLVEQPEKAYSRDPVMEIGRLKVQLKVNNTAVNPDIPNRPTLYRKIAELIPTLSSRNVTAKKAGGKKGKK